MAFRAGGADFAGVKTKKRARERALCVRQNWGHRAKSHFLPLLIRLARLSRTKPRGRACIRRLRRPYAVQKKRFESDGSQPVKADSALPSHHLRIMEKGEALQCRVFSGGRYASVLCTIFLA
jgi:hypothetical protein